MAARVIVATGAFDCGKSTTLAYLRDHHGHRVHEEAHVQVLAAIRSRTVGHAPDAELRYIDDPSHLCPVCRPAEFAALVLERQLAIEASARDGDILERGVFDPIQYARFHPRDGHPLPVAVQPHADYTRVLLFEVMPELQRPRWGKSHEQRIAEARTVNEQLATAYEKGGYDVTSVPPGTVAERAAFIRRSLS